MNFSAKKTAVFAAASMLSAAGWALFWPPLPPANHLPIAATPPAVPANAAEASSSVKLQQLLDAVEKAPDGGSRLEACRRLSGIPVSDIPAALEKTPPVGHRLMTLGEQVLLIHWAEHDSPAAMKWAWLHYRRAPERIGGNGFLGDPTWSEAFRQIAPVWAYHDPQQFGNWVMKHIPDRPEERYDHPTEEQVQASEEPILSQTYSPEEMTVKYVMRYSPRLAFQIRLKWGVTSTNDEEFAKYLETSAQVKDALLAFDHPSLPEGAQGNNPLRLTLLERWKELDPEGFARATHQMSPEEQQAMNMNDPIDAWEKLPPEQRREGASRALEDKKDISRREILISLISAWTRKDSNGCRKWIDTLPQEDVAVVAVSYASLLGADDPAAAFEWTENLSFDQRLKAIVNVCDSWARHHPGQQPDFTGWSEDEKEAWEDLAAVRALAKKP